MRSSKEFFDRLSNDEQFLNEVSAAIEARREDGAANYYETFIPVAEELGYEVTKEDLDKIYDDRVSEMSEEELGKIAGGTSCLPSTTSIVTISLIVTSVTSLSVTLEIADPE